MLWFAIVIPCSSNLFLWSTTLLFCFIIISFCSSIILFSSCVLKIYQKLNEKLLKIKLITSSTTAVDDTYIGNRTTILIISRILNTNTGVINRFDSNFIIIFIWNESVRYYFSNYIFSCAVMKFYFSFYIYKLIILLICSVVIVKIIYTKYMYF